MSECKHDKYRFVSKEQKKVGDKEYEQTEIWRCQCGEKELKTTQRFKVGKENG